MNLTNRLGLPEAIVRAIANDSYERPNIKNYFSCTELLVPPRQRALKLRHGHEIVEDASDRIWSLFGQAVHSICERGATHTEMVEKRFYIEIEVDGVVYTVGAQIDNLGLENGMLSDYKTTSAYKVKGPRDLSWEAQLNIQGHILQSNMMEVSAVQIVALLRDHSKADAKRDSSYPQVPVVVVPFPFWPREHTIGFIKDRIRAHKRAEESLPLCTDEDRWATKDKWALMKKGNKRAVALFDNEALAVNASADAKHHYVEKRPGESRRCGQYCVASPWCEQYAKEVAEKQMNQQKGD